VLNGAGEVAVRAFLEEKIPFLSIAEVIEDALAKTERMQVENYAVLQETDARARVYAKEAVERITKAGK